LGRIEERNRGAGAGRREESRAGIGGTILPRGKNEGVIGGRDRLELVRDQGRTPLFQDYAVARMLLTYAPYAA